MINELSSMLGHTMVSVTAGQYCDEMVFTSDTGKTFKFLHYQNCCESVGIEEVIGDLTDLVGSPIILAEEVDNADAPPSPVINDDCSQWTFYRFATGKGLVTVRWLGTSNGYYSTSVSFEESP